MSNNFKLLLVSVLLISFTVSLSKLSSNDLKDEQSAQAHKIDILERAIAEADAEAKEAYFKKWSKLNKEAEEKTGIKTTISK